MTTEKKNLPEPDARDVRELHEGEHEDHPNDTRIVKASLKLPSANVALSYLDQIAVLAHEANRVWCILHGDLSQPSYLDAPDWQKASARAGVQGIADGTITNPRQSHESWLKQKAEEGWKYGAVKNPATKEHPCFVPYDKLPPEQQAKDAIFFNLVNGLVNARPR